MYLSHWKLQASPFAGRMDPSCLFPSVTHQEAIARLEFLCVNQRPLGVLLGPSGIGKSLVLRKLEQLLGRQGFHVVSTSLISSTPEELMWRLATGLGCGPRSGISPPHLWAAICDCVVDHRRLAKSTIFLLDDVHAAPNEIQSMLLRLVHVDPSPDARHTIVLAGDNTQLHKVSSSLLDLVDLRVDLDPWEASETASYVKGAIAAAGISENIFDEEALTLIHELSCGIPRQVNRLADLTLLAAAGQASDHIDSATVSAVAEELVVC